MFFLQKCLKNLWLFVTISLVELMDIYNRGIDLKSPLYSDEDIQTLKRYVASVDELFEEALVELEELLVYLMEAFEANREDGDYYQNLNSSQWHASTYKDLSFFAQVGHPVPKDEVIDDYLNARFQEHMINKIAVLTKEKDNKLSYRYLLLFYEGAMAMKEHNSELAGDLFNVVLDLTEDDQYNEYRIVAEQMLAELSTEETLTSTAPPVEEKPETTKEKVKPKESQPVKKEKPTSTDINSPFPMGTTYDTLVNHYGQPTYDDYFLGSRLLLFNDEIGFFIDGSDRVTGFMFYDSSINILGTNVGMTQKEIRATGKSVASFYDETESQMYTHLFEEGRYKIIYASHEEHGPTSSVIITTLK